MMRTAYDGLADEDVPRPVLHLVKDLDGKHVDGHNRLSVQTTDFAHRIDALETKVTLHDEQLKNAAKRTTDISSLRFTPAMVFAVVAVCASIIGGAYASTWGMRSEQIALRSDIRDLSTMYASQVALEQERNKNLMLQVVQQGSQIQTLATQMASLKDQVSEMSLAMRQRNK